MKFIYKLFTSDKINFLDEILEKLETKPKVWEEDEIAPLLCFYDQEFQKGGRDFLKTTRKFIPVNAERLFFRNSALYLQRENLITVIGDGLYHSCKYIINYEGIILVRNGGLAKNFFWKN